VLGRLSGVFGVRGRLKLWSYTDPPDAILGYGELQLRVPGGGAERPVSLVGSRAHGKGFVIQIDGVDDPDTAASLVGSELAVDRSRLPDPSDGEYYWVDLEGLAVATIDGRALGRVERMMETGANDVMVVVGDRERLIPFTVGHTVRDVDLKGGLIRVDWDPDF
jgi:16S rRNA processing protein RimM